MVPQPVGYGREKTLEPTAVAGTVVPVDRLPASDSPTVAAWRALLHDPDADIRLPPVAHALCNNAGDAVVSEAYARRAFTETRRVAERLAGRVHAELRDYQLRGVSWLAEATGLSTELKTGPSTELRTGVILADEMGLGKTLQTVAHLVDAGTGPVLIVCPTGLVSNWLREISRWAPDALRATDYRGGGLDAARPANSPARPVNNSVRPAHESEPPLVVVTGYPTLRRHGATLAEIPWATVVFDEAQALKNPRTQVARAARALDARSRIALTGTPVENHLDELWALLNLVAPADFGNRALFRRRYTLPIQSGSAEAKARMLDAVSSHVLRRTKAGVAADLGPKLHNDVECDLTDEQERLYDAILDRAESEGFGTGMARRGAILTALTHLKQVCNHPALVSPAPFAGRLEGRSGKLDVCTDIVLTNVENRCPTVVFTQYRQTGELLARHLGTALNAEAPFLHGGLSLAERDRIVDEYQSGAGCGILVASLKAAGTGLTLTRAADVVHFDRWWNPAVEAQATDRVHRIGQERIVTVTTLTTAGTLEEHIAAMHHRKTALDLDSDTGALALLTELSDERLIEVLRRRREESS
ncbi:DEAD/DEAH box helicase [Gordonia iterans]|uniref:DEAD/DEAH box helicase n=1 Tax=Gordonia iterans TaxID=1004901 RepID=UPI001F228A39|nr:DEAD/DEAH box helicase [Gordonia iterans]